MFKQETGSHLYDVFAEFDTTPLGVASLAQVHRAVDRKTGRPVAVKIMHVGLEDFAEIDMRTTSAMLDFVKRVFPTFEFSWLGEEMRQNLPKEMDFGVLARSPLDKRADSLAVHEADNAMRCRRDFARYKHTPVVVPDVRSLSVIEIRAHLARRSSGRRSASSSWSVRVVVFEVPCRLPSSAQTSRADESTTSTTSLDTTSIEIAYRKSSLVSSARWSISTASFTVIPCV